MISERVGSQRPKATWHQKLVAVFDMDGTLLPCTLGQEMLRELAASGKCDPREARALFDVLSDREKADFGWLAEKVYEHYPRAVAGVSADEFAEVAERTWRRVREHIFPYVPGLFEMLRGHGYRLFIISGSPVEIIRAAAGELGADGFCGARLQIIESKLTDRLTCAPGLPGQKTAALRSLTAGQDVDWARSFAVGNSASDAEVLEMTGLSMAFEPDPELRLAAANRNWVIADRDNVLQKSQQVLDWCN